MSKKVFVLNPIPDGGAKKTPYQFFPGKFQKRWN